MSFRGASGTLRRGLSNIMLKPLGLASTRSREEYEKDEREFERLFVLFESFLQQERATSTTSPSNNPSSTTSSSSSSSTTSPPSAVPPEAAVHDKSKKGGRISKRQSASKKTAAEEDEEKGGGKGVMIIVENNNNSVQCGEAAATEEEEHEVRFVVGLLNGYLALKRLSMSDKDLTFSLAHNKKKEEQRERKELEKLRSEVVLRMTSALTDLGALPAASSPAPATTATASPPPSSRPSGLSASRSAGELTAAKPNRTSWRGRLRLKEKKADEQPAGKELKSQLQSPPPAESSTPEPQPQPQPRPKPQAPAAVEEGADWRAQLLSPRSAHKRSQSLTFEPLATTGEGLSGGGEPAYEPRIPLAELEERMRRMEELIERRFAAAHQAAQAELVAAPEGKKKRWSLNPFLRRSSNKIATGAAKEKDRLSKRQQQQQTDASRKTLEDDDDGEDGDENDEDDEDDDEDNEEEEAQMTSIYTKMLNRRSVYHYDLKSLQEMLAQHHPNQAPDRPAPAPPPASAAETVAVVEDSPATATAAGDEPGESRTALPRLASGSRESIKVVCTVTPPSPPVPALNLAEVKNLPAQGFLSPEPRDSPITGAAKPAWTSSALSPLAYTPSSPSPSSSSSSSSSFSSSPLSSRTTSTTTTPTSGDDWRRSGVAKRDKMIWMRVLDCKFGATKNVKWAFLWCEENVAPPTLAKVVRAQAYVKRYLARRLRKRLQIANELLLTEKHYVDILELVVRVFLQPLLLTGDALVPQETIRTIFGNTETLRDKHVIFHELLHKRVRDWMTFQQFGVGDIFYDHTDFLLGYTDYVNNFDQAVAVLAHAMKAHPEFASYVRTCEARPECNLHDLPSLLITPVQRIPRYALLLQDLQRHTPAGSRPGLLEMALKKVRDIANYINEQKRLNENAVKMAQLEAQLIFDPKPKVGLCEVSSRKFVKEGRVLIQLGRKQFKECHIFLFTDLLLITRNDALEDDDEVKERPFDARPARGDDQRYVVKVAEPLNENPIEISPLPPFFLDKATRFPLRLYLSSQRKEYRCVFGSQNERDDWLQRIVGAHASSRRRPYSILSVRRGFTPTSSSS